MQGEAPAGMTEMPGAAPMTRGFGERDGMQRTRYRLPLASSLALALILTVLSTAAFAWTPDGHHQVEGAQQQPTSTPAASPTATPSGTRVIVVVPPIPTSVPTPTLLRTSTPAVTSTPRPTFSLTFVPTSTRTPTPGPDGAAPARAGGLSPSLAAMAVGSLGTLSIAAGLALRRRRP
jgi:hypothetical protein